MTKASQGSSSTLAAPRRSVPSGAADEKAEVGLSRTSSRALSAGLPLRLWPVVVRLARWQVLWVGCASVHPRWATASQPRPRPEPWKVGAEEAGLSGVRLQGVLYTEHLCEIWTGQRSGCGSRVRRGRCWEVSADPGPGRDALRGDGLPSARVELHIRFLAAAPAAKPSPAPDAGHGAEPSHTPEWRARGTRAQLPLGTKTGGAPSWGHLPGDSVSGWPLTQMRVPLAVLGWGPLIRGSQSLSFWRP